MQAREVAINPKLFFLLSPPSVNRFMSSGCHSPR
jgi:hypothetical protein